MAQLQAQLDASGEQPDEDNIYAGLVTRAIALAIDAIVIDVVGIGVTGAVLLIESVFAVSNKHHPAVAVVGGVLFVVWMVGYFVVFWTTTGQTPGSRVMEIRLTRVDGSRLKPRHALLRLGGMVVSLPLFWGYLPVLTTPRRRGVPDTVGGTIVTVVPPEVTVVSPEVEAAEIAESPAAGPRLPPAGGGNRGA